MRSSAAWPSVAAAVTLLIGGCEFESDYRTELFVFGTFVTIDVYDARRSDFYRASDAIAERYLELDRDWYPWDDGELRRVNDAIANGETIAVSAPLARLVQAAAHYENLTGGRFNAGLGRISELWGFDRLPDAVDAPPDAAAIAAVLAERPGAATLEWAQSSLVGAGRATMLDLGGIAKGALLLEAAGILEAHGIDNAIVNLGGDLLVIGRVNGRDAQIGIRSPAAEDALAGLTVAPGEAVFTSGSYERYVEIDGERFAHILDPRTGMPVRHTVSVTVVDRDPIRADAAATALLVGGSGAFDELVAALGLEFALLIDASGDVRLTSGLRERLHWKAPGMSQ